MRTLEHLEGSVKVPVAGLEEEAGLLLIDAGEGTEIFYHRPRDVIVQSHPNGKEGASGEKGPSRAARDHATARAQRDKARQYNCTQST